MNKNRIFLILMTLISVLLFIFRMTGITAHLVISIIGLVIMIPLTIATNKEWKIPALEVIMRIMYFVAIVTGAVLMNVEGIVALSIVHKIGAVLFVVLLMVLYIPKLKNNADS